MKKKIILSSVVTIVLCLTLIAGSTFALFSEEANIDVTVTSGKVDIEVKLDGLKTTSMGNDTDVNGVFDLGGTAAITDDYAIDVVRMVPGDAVSVNINVTNNSNVAISYCVRMIGNGKLIEALEASVEVNGVKSVINGTENMSAWVNIGANEAIPTIPVTIYFPNADDNNDYQDQLANTIRLQVVAVQGNGVDMYETVDTFWYDSTKDTLEISSAADLEGFAKLVNAGNSFAGKTVVLTSDIDLGGAEWTPIGVTEGTTNVFRGTFDGAGHTVSNFTITGEHDVGFFKYLCGTVKNVNFDNAHVTGTHWVGVVAGKSYYAIENCKVTNFTVTANVEEVGANQYDNGDKAGAVVGYSADGSSVTGCVAENGTVKAFRDVGAVIGAAQTVNTCSNLSADSTVSIEVIKVSDLPDGSIMVDNATNTNIDDSTDPNRDFIGRIVGNP